jgi:creatinine amidohydrolase
VQIDSTVLHPFARELFRNLLRIGFRNVHVIIHHQSENFAVGMPTDLAFKLAGRQIIFEFLEQQRGEGWWGDSSMATYYDQHEAGTDPFSWIQFHPFMDAETQAKYPIDHAGEQETSLMLAFCPEGVDMQRHSAEKWYAQQATQANDDYAAAAKTAILASLRAILT